MAPLSEKRVRALEILRRYPGLTPHYFGRKMWPGDPGWNRYGKCGPNGSTAGVGMRLAAGAFLGKLKKEGLVSVSFGGPGGYEARHYLTSAGENALGESPSADDLEF